jgi:hypothetical protein
VQRRREEVSSVFVGLLVVGGWWNKFILNLRFSVVISSRQSTLLSLDLACLGVGSAEATGRSAVLVEEEER